MRSSILLLLLLLPTLVHAADDPIAAFKAAYAAGDEPARLAAVAEVARVQSHSRAVCDALAGALLKDDSSKVRKAIVEALGDQWDGARAAPILAKALANAKETDDVLMAVIEALGDTGSDAAVPTLAALLTPRSRAYRGSELRAQDELLVPITQAALVALRRTGSAKGVEPLLEFLHREVPVGGPLRRREKLEAKDPLLKHAEAALTAISGEHYQGVQAWTSWWRENKSKVRTFQVLRCEQTGKTFDKTSTGRCPFDGDQHPRCGTFLRTRLENGGTGEEDDATPERRKRKKK